MHLLLHTLYYILHTYLHTYLQKKRFVKFCFLVQPHNGVT